MASDPNPQFHPYPRFPAEVQSIVWKFYCEDQAIVRHVLDIFGTCTAKPTTSFRVYAALDEERREFIDQFVKADVEDARDLHSEKLTLGTGWGTYHPAALPLRHGWLEYLYRTDIPIIATSTIPGVDTPACFWGNLKRDIFYFPGRLPRTKTPLDSWDRSRDFGFRFWFRTLGFDNLFDLLASRNSPTPHWIFRVRRLAMTPFFLRVLDENKDWTNRHVLVRMKELRELFVVVDNVPSGLDPKNLPPKADRKLAETQYRHATPEHIGFMPVAEKRLTKLFEDHHMQVEVKLVVDFYQM
ncbi:hypothetical protein F5B20DRAFT_520407 [Whalleya microplaca]|nr:hypothetical protein F5B20DRAFT_520407 [Whalleya microplaca]